MSDGGNVEFVEIDGPVVYLRLKGACGSCPSSLTTMTMGIKRRLMEKIPVRLPRRRCCATPLPTGMRTLQCSASATALCGEAAAAADGSELRPCWRLDADAAGIRPAAPHKLV